jgi:hypothetical protein
MAVSPGLGWSNSLPDSEAKVDFVLNGTALSFTGAGYHDQVRDDLAHPSLFLFILLSQACECRQKQALTPLLPQIPHAR